MIEFYVSKINANEMTIEDVPEMWKAAVEAVLKVQK